ncbi:MAG: hypothetical protein WAK03_00045 [Methylocystis sp.]
MVVSREKSIAGRTSRIVLLVTAAAGLLAAVAAAPAAPTDRDLKSAVSNKAQGGSAATLGEAAKGMQPLGRGPAIRVGRAFDAEDEDCTLAVTRVTDESGHVRVKRGVTCAN